MGKIFQALPLPPKKCASRLYMCMEPPMPLAAPSTRPISSAITSRQGLTLVRFSAQREHVSWDTLCDWDECIPVSHPVYTHFTSLTNPPYTPHTLTK